MVGNRRSLVLGPLLALGVAAAPLPTLAAPAAEPTWGPAARLAQGSDLGLPSVAVGPQGAVTVAWRQGADVLAARRGPEGGWSAATRVGGGLAPQLAADGAGNVTALWTRHLAGHGPQVMTARRPVGGSWSSPSAVTPPVASHGNSAHGAFEPRLAVADDGTTLVCWLHEADDSGASQVQARLRPAGGPWRPAVTLSPVEARTPTCDVADGGAAVVVYTVLARVLAVRHDAGGWHPRVRLGRHALPPEVALDEAGGAVATWSALGDDDVFRPRASYGDPAGGWTSAVTLDTENPRALHPSVAGGAPGDAQVVWVGADGQARTSHALDGTWQASPVDASDAGAARPGLAPRVVAWGEDYLLSWTSSDDRVTATSGPGGGPWSAPRTLSPATRTASPADLATGAGGRAALAWRSRDSSGTWRIEVRLAG